MSQVFGFGCGGERGGGVRSDLNISQNTTLLLFSGENPVCPSENVNNFTVLYAILMEYALFELAQQEPGLF